MKRKMNKKLKGIPVYAIALLLVAGTVAGAGIWILTVEVPVDYNEPVDIYYSSEDMVVDDLPQGEPDENPGEWNGPVRLRDQRTRDATELTYGTLHDFINATNPDGGKDPVNLTVEIDAYDTGDEATNDIGFVVISGLVGARNVTSWDYDGDGNREFANYDGDSYEVQWGNTTIEKSLTSGDGVSYTVINVVADGEAGENPTDVDGYEIQWTLYDDSTEEV